MGFFHSDVAPRKAPAPRARVQLTPELQQNLSCTQCPLNRADLRTPKMPPSGLDQPLFYFLGGPPSAREDENGINFSGDSGSMLLPLVPVELEPHCRWNHTIRCHSTKVAPGGIETTCCRRYQVEDIQQTKPWAIIGLGPEALDWAVGGGKQISNWRGRRMPVKIGTHTCWFYCVEAPAYVAQMSGNRDTGAAHQAVFARDIRRVFEDYNVGGETAYVEDPADYRKGILCVDQYGTAGLDLIADRLGALRDIEHAVDIETNGLRPYGKDYKILSVASGTYDSTIAFGWMHSEARWTTAERGHLHDIVEWYLKGAGRKWCHEARFEQEWFLREFNSDILYMSPWGCTLCQAYVLDARTGKDLGSLTVQNFGFNVKSLSHLDKTKMEYEPLNLILPYNGLDTKYTDALRYVQAERLECEGLVATYDIENNMNPSLVQMQAKGVVRNLPAIKELDADLKAKKEKIINEIMCQPDVMEFRNTGNAFSPTSNPNLVVFFRDYLRLPNPKRGEGYSVDESVLSEFKHPVGDLLLSLRDIQKIHGYVTPLLDGGKYVHDDGRVHASYSQTITVSSRLACEDPNQQNYPRREHPEIRRVVGCPEGYWFVAFDYGQLEWRVGAEESGDKTMLAEIVAKQDIHGHWTDKLGIDFVPHKLKESRKKVRDAIKGLWTFANLYGNTLNGLAWGLSKHFEVNISPEALEPYYIEFWDLYPGLRAHQDGLIKKYEEIGYVETMTGFRRRGILKRNELINHPYQGAAGTLVAEGGTRLSYEAWRQQRPSLQSIFNIHDDLSFYLSKNTTELEADIEYIARTMTHSPFIHTVPLSVEVSMGDNWCDVKNLHTFTTTDFQ